MFIPQDRPPLLPGSRGYTVQGNVKMNFPQTRVMKQTYTGTSMYMDHLGKR